MLLQILLRWLWQQAFQVEARTEMWIQPWDRCLAQKDEKISKKLKKEEEKEQREEKKEDGDGEDKKDDEEDDKNEEKWLA